MNAHAPIQPMTSVPTVSDGDRAVAEARHVFRRTLSCWACDMLTLRTIGLIDPAWRGDADRGPRDLDLAA